MRASIAGVLLLLAACGSKLGNKPDAQGEIDAIPTPDACVGLRCQQVTCQGGVTTSLSGTVYAPNGTLPLYGVTVYVPNADPGPMPAGVRCDQCDNALPGDPIVITKTDEAGKFKLENVPVSPDLPLVIQVGKWRRQLKVATVAQCQDNPLVQTQTTLPKDRTEGDLPLIAIATGNADALECLVRKVGIADTEITTDTDATPGRVHLFASNGANKFDASHPGGARNFNATTTLWSSVDKLKAYDIAIFSCEGAQNAGSKPQPAMDAVAAFADMGGRVFLSHWHNIWLEGNTQAARGGAAAYGPAAGWGGIATFSDGNGTIPNGTNDTIDEVQPKGVPFATWMLNVGGSTTRGLIPVNQGKLTCTAIDNTKADRWVYLDPANNGGTGGIQTLQFTVPQSQPKENRCGKVVFSDMHVSSGSSSSAGTGYPKGCATGDLSAQEKALAFMFFDIASCVGGPIF